MELRKGDVVFNGFYKIELIEDARFVDFHNRYMARGYRWVPSRKEWEATPKLYGWSETFNHKVG